MRSVLGFRPGALTSCQVVRRLPRPGGIHIERTADGSLGGAAFGGGESQEGRPGLAEGREMKGVCAAVGQRGLGCGPRSGKHRRFPTSAITWVACEWNLIPLSTPVGMWWPHRWKTSNEFHVGGENERTKHDQRRQRCW